MSFRPDNGLYQVFSYRVIFQRRTKKYSYEWQIVALCNVSHYISLTFSFQQRHLSFPDVHFILE